VNIVALRDKPHLYKNTIDLIERALGYDIENKFAVDFAPLMDESNWHHCYLLVDEKRDMAIGHIGVRVRKIGTHSVAFIGGIAIHENYRERGYFKRLMNFVIREYQEGVAFFLLWSDLRSLYESFGFCLAVGQLEFKASALSNESYLTEHGYVKALYKDLSATYKEQIQNIYNNVTCKQYLTIRRLSSDWEIIEMITSSSLFYRTNNNGEINSYLFMNKGQDLKNIIHELGYQERDKSSTLYEMKSCLLWLPETEKTAFNETDYAVKYMGLIRMGSFNMFKKFISDCSEGGA